MELTAKINNDLNENNKCINYTDPYLGGSLVVGGGGKRTTVISL